MKNQITIKSFLVHTLCIAGTFVFTSANTIADSREVANSETEIKAIVVVKNDDDAKFLVGAAEMQLEEIQLAKLAQQKGRSTQVKDLGKKMEATHNETFTELKALAKSKSITIPTTISKDSQEAYDKLDKKTGNDFDKAYSKMMVEHHEDAIKAFEKVAADSKDPEIRTWASNKLPGLKANLKHAETCKKESNTK